MRNQMQTSLNLTIVFLLIAVFGVAQKRHFGNYFNKWRYWGPMFVLKADSTFEYKERTNAGTVTITEPAQYGTISRTTDSYVFSDSSYGTYRIINDTIFLSYATDEVKGDFNGYNIRPKKLYWKGKALCYIHPETGAVLRQKEYYMTWSKWKAPNLSKTDETNSQRAKLD
jgi:hypothetical protein